MTEAVPPWLEGLAIASLIAGGVCAAALAIDIARHPQPMRIMNAVWPVCALFGGLLIVGQYARYGRAGRHAGLFPIQVANDTLHCGSGCTLGDIAAEWLVFAFPAIAVAFGWHSLFGEMMFAMWIVDYLFAYAFGIIFQYFAIAPMRHLPLGPGLIAAVKADTLSLTAWQLGMYGFMALMRFVIFPAGLATDTPVFWFMMQIAMLCGFATSYPANWFLLRTGVKEPM